MTAPIVYANVPDRPIPLQHYYGHEQHGRSIALIRGIYAKAGQAPTGRLWEVR